MKLILREYTTVSVRTQVIIESWHYAGLKLAPLTSEKRMIFQLVTISRFIISSSQLILTNKFLLINIFLTGQWRFGIIKINYRTQPFYWWKSSVRPADPVLRSVVYFVIRMQIFCRYLVCISRNFWSAVLREAPPLPQFQWNVTHYSS